MPNAVSIKSAIVYRLIIPIMFFIVVFETVFSYVVTLHNVQETYDRWLLDSARSLEQEVKLINDQVSVNLSDTALKIFKWDDVDSTYFKIQSENQGVLVGDLPLRDPSPPLDGKPLSFSNFLLNGEELRMVSLKVSGDLPEEVYIHVAETLNKRRNRFIEILIADLAPQLLLTLIIGIVLIHGVNKGLGPLYKLADDIAQRSPSDLSPIAESSDFEEIRILTETINQLFTKLSSSISAQQRFIANAAHQLRTPLAGLKLQAERAQREEVIAMMRPALMQIQNSADRISHLINQLLVLARSVQIEDSHEFELIDLLELSKKVCMEWVPKALEKEMSLSFVAHDKPLFVECNTVLLTELMANLLHNAIVYGVQRGNILVSLAENSPVLTIEDDGPGISSAEAKKVFERFYRTPGSSGKGCGLGLAIVREIADLHGITLDLSTSEMGGVRIALRFPERS